MVKKLKLVSFKDLEFAIVDYKVEAVQDPFDKTYTNKSIPRFEPVRLTSSFKTFNGQQNGQPIILRQKTMVLSEDSIENTYHYDTGVAVEYYTILRMFMEDAFVKEKFVVGDMKIELYVDEDSDKEVIKWLVEQSLIQMEWISNTAQYVQAKQGENNEKAKQLIFEAATSEAAANLELGKKDKANDSNPEDIANSPNYKEVKEKTSTKKVTAAPNPFEPLAPAV